MNKWLASVQSLEEARILLSALPDILDMKDPSQGTLGALSVAKVVEIVRLIDGQCQTSATIGNLAMKAEKIKIAMLGMAESGVDYIKVGIVPDADLTQCIISLTDTVKRLRIPVIAVLFADKEPEIDCLPLLEKSGFNGVMVDTAIKNGQCLLDHWDLMMLKTFVNSVHEREMMCGLAGALRYEDIRILRPLGANYLGFRSALCQQRQRTSRLNLMLAEQVQRAIGAE